MNGVDSLQSQTSTGSVPRGTRALLWAAVTVPFLYLGTVFISALFYPGYSHITQYASELGSTDATYPGIFNGGILLTGLVSLAIGPAFAHAIKAEGGNRVLGIILVVVMVLFGISMCMGALFPMPDPRHGGFGLGMGIHLAPFLLAAALWKAPNLRRLNIFLLLIGIAMLLLFIIMMGVGELITQSNVGLFQRIFVLTIFPWIGIAAYVLCRRL